MSRVNHILNEHADSRSKLTIRTFTDTEEVPETYVLIEGDQAALQFLAELILAHASSDVCNLAIHPQSAGKLHFSNESTAGIYIHRVPCDLHRDDTIR
ncbi:MAG: hypothetical protein WB992_18565 [Bryobacteraceae bacterium]